jgi:hypothetical protein
MVHARPRRIIGISENESRSLGYSRKTNVPAKVLRPIADDDDDDDAEEEDRSLSLLVLFDCFKMKSLFEILIFPLVMF